MGLCFFFWGGWFRWLITSNSGHNYGYLYILHKMESQGAYEEFLKHVTVGERTANVQRAQEQFLNEHVERHFL